MKHRAIILGGGMTGLAAGMASGFPVFEAEKHSGGICSSYYMGPGDFHRQWLPKATSYRFELGGGHWIFGGDPSVLEFIRSMTPVRKYHRKSSVYFPDQKRYVPYPLQNHLEFLDRKIRSKVMREISRLKPRKAETMADALKASFGQTLTRFFFDPFHELYTAGLWKSIKSQDSYKTPEVKKNNKKPNRQGLVRVGYNTTFLYPEEGLNKLAERMAERCKIFYGKKAVRVDLKKRKILWEGGGETEFDSLISTLPLNVICRLSGVKTRSRPDPYTSVLVMNIGGLRGSRCPKDHWIYVPKSETGFHRVGFYSNVDDDFLPRRPRSGFHRVGIYVEQAFLGGCRPSDSEVGRICQKTVEELKKWSFLSEVEVVDPTWVEVAYTWSWPGSSWVKEAMDLLHSHQVYPVGRYARWCFQGIADSIRDGFMAGAALRHGL